MGLSHSPGIVIDGLIYSIDAANTRSYSGIGNTVYTLAGNVNGSLLNGLGFTSANSGTFVFDGANDSIDLGDSFDIGLSSYSICTYFKAASMSGLHGIFSKSIADAASFRYAVFINSNKINTFMSNGGATDVMTPSSMTVSLNTWYHAGIVFDRPDKVTLFVNGVFDSSATISQFQAINFQTNFNFRIGSYGDAGNNPSYFFNGSISQFQMYNRSLSATEIRQNFNATRKRYGI